MWTVMEPITSCNRCCCPDPENNPNRSDIRAESEHLGTISLRIVTRSYPIRAVNGHVSGTACDFVTQGNRNRNMIVLRVQKAAAILS